MLPKKFLAVYECENCSEEYDMENCFVPYFWMQCDGCGAKTRFVSQKLIHLEFEWDRIEEHED
jgi:predicted nucleic acid-binding Zn ribbon protein